MFGGQGGLGCWFQGLGVESLFEDGLDTFVTMRAEVECAGTGGIEPLIAVGVGEAQYAETGTIALLGMRSFGDDPGDEGSGFGTDLRRPLL